MHEVNYILFQPDFFFGTYDVQGYDAISFTVNIDSGTSTIQ